MNEETGALARSLSEVDRVVHEPARLMILAILYAAASADFLYIQQATQLTKGNLSSHLAKLESARYIEIEKKFNGKIPLTVCRMTDAGRSAFENYRKQMKDLMESI